MRSICIGKNADGRDIAITAKMRQTTHTHVIGGSGTGKSKFIEWLTRQDIRAGNGFCLIDWHGTLYQDVVRYCANLDVGLDGDFRKVILINPSLPNFITGFNPFMNQGVDVSVQVSQRIAATIRPWGVTSTDLMPTFENVMRALYTFAIERGETLPNAAYLIEYNRPELREYAASVVTDRQGQAQLQRLVETKTARDWRELVLSTQNRIGRFIGSTAVRRFMGLKTGNLDLRQAMDDGHIVLVNLGSSDYLDREAARVFASLFLYEFFETSMRRANETYGRKPETYVLYLDEFQEYITDDIASMLDEVRKGGLHMVLAHQHLGHLLENPKLLKSILINARIRAVFGGLDYEDACRIANEMFLPDLNSRQIKKAYWHTIHLYREETRIVRSRTDSVGTDRSANWTETDGESLTSGSSQMSTSGSGRSSGVARTQAASDSYGKTNSIGSGRNSGTGLSVPRDYLGIEGRQGLIARNRGQSSSESHNDSENTSESESMTESETTSEFESQSFGTNESETISKSSSVGGGISRSESTAIGESEVPVWVPIPVKELGSESEWSREEKLSKVAELLKVQQQRHCFIKLDTELTQPLLVPFVRTYPMSREILDEYEREVYEEQGALSAAVVDGILVENEKAFLASAQLAEGPEIDSTKVVNVTPIEEKRKLLASKPKKGIRLARKSLFATIEEPVTPDL